ncbi:MAG: hypothetical protein EPN57_09515 [Paraburkholderia sp.]|nr:MAG: hypothetical protein EPN57_09515 [Paraburkholderia sp.]
MSSSADPAVAARSLAQCTFDVWPPSLLTLFDGMALASKVGFSASLITCDEEDRLRTSLLGPGELYAPDARHLAFALWPSSRAVRALMFADDAVVAQRTGSHAERVATTHRGLRRARAALTIVHEGAFYQVQLSVETMCAAQAGEGGQSGQPGTAGGLAHFIASIDAGEIQQVGYARLTSGIAFALTGVATDRAAVLNRWESQIEQLRQAAHTHLAARKAADS